MLSESARSTGGPNVIASGKRSGRSWLVCQAFWLSVPREENRVRPWERFELPSDWGPDSTSLDVITSTPARAHANQVKPKHFRLGKRFLDSKFILDPLI